jgi:hypothetical protein
MTVLFDVLHSTSWKGITYHPGLQNIPDDLARALGYQEKIVPDEEVAPTVTPTTAEAVSTVETPATLQNPEVLPAVETSTTEEVASVVEIPPTPLTEGRRRRSG